MSSYCAPNNFMPNCAPTVPQVTLCPKHAPTHVLESFQFFAPTVPQLYLNCAQLFLARLPNCLVWTLSTINSYLKILKLVISAGVDVFSRLQFGYQLNHSYSESTVLDLGIGPTVKLYLISCSTLPPSTFTLSELIQSSLI